MGASATLSTSNHHLVNNGTLRGVGTLDLGSSNTWNGSTYVYTLYTLTNNNMIDPGVGSGGAGALSIVGNLVMGSGSQLNIDVNSAIAGNFDFLRVSGTANLTNGTLNVSGAGTSDEITVLASATANGLGGTMFGTLNGLQGMQATQYLSNKSLMFSNTDFSALRVWDGGAGNANFSTAGNWNNAQAPIATDTVYIPGSAGTVSVNSNVTVARIVGRPNISQSAGTLTLNGATTLYGYTMTGGVLTGTGDLTITDQFDWSAGTIGGNGSNSLTTSGTTNATGNVAIVNNRIWNNSGTLKLPVGSGGLELNSATLNNQATGTIQIDSSDTSPIYTSGGGTVNNAGIINYTNPATVAIATTLSNTGTLNVDAGTLVINGAFTSNAGTIKTAAGATFQKNGGFTNIGTLTGAGTFNVGTGYTLTNSGRIRPAGNGATGTLSISGNLANSSTGIIESELGGGSGGQYDVVAVTGSASLGGTLNVSLLNGFTPSSGSFDVITAGGTTSGSFTTMYLPSGMTGATVGSLYRLTASGTTCSVCTWDGGGDSDYSWSLAANWTNDLVPATGATVTIGSGYGTISYDLNSLSLASLTTDSAFSLASGKQLTLATAGTFNAPLSLGAGASLTAQGTLALASSPSLAAGAKINISQSGAGILTIGDLPYTVINSLGSAGSTTALDLQGMRGDLSGRYALGLDINASSTATWNTNGSGGYDGFLPIGNEWLPFTGKFDGLGHAITGLYINRPTINYVGLFGASSGEIRNLDLLGAQVAGNAQVGGLAGWNSGSIVNASVSAGSAVAGFGGDIGGLVGWNSGTLEGSHVNGSSVTGGAGAANIGGLVGDNSYDGEIRVSHAAASLVVGAGATYVGGLVGSDDGTVTWSHYNIDASPINGEKQVTRYGLYADQFNAWLGKPDGAKYLQVADYFVAPDNSGYYSVSGVQGLKNLLAFADGPDYRFRLADFVDLGVGIAPLTGYSIPYFAGEFDGGGHAIRNVSINQPYNSQVGLFGWNTGYIHDLAVTGAVAGRNAVGGLVGYNDPLGTLRNVQAMVTVSGTDWSIGGLVGENDGLIDHGHATVTINAPDWGSASKVGGLVGENWSGTIIASEASGTIIVGGYADAVGGLVGYNHLGSISGSHANITLTVGANASFVGGLVGYNEDSSISTSYASGTITAGDNASFVGGLVGYSWLNSSSVDSAPHSFIVNEGVTTIPDVLGSITASHADVELRVGASSAYLGGLVGYNSGGGISASYATGTITALENAHDVGGLVGYHYDGSGTGLIAGSHADVALSLGAGSGYVGGLVGYNDSGFISASYATGTITAPGNAHDVGGLVGYNSTLYQSGSISSSYAGVGLSVGAESTGIGGLVGTNDGGSISASYATGPVTAGSGALYVGGLVGTNDGGSISASYATGPVTAGSGALYVGGLVGYGIYTYGGGVSSSYWDIDSTGQVSGTGEVLLPTDTPGTYDGTGIHSTTGTINAYNSATYAGFDFASENPVWWMSEGNTRPFLRMEWSDTITNAHQLQLMAMNLSASYTLANNLDMAPALSAVSWQYPGMWSSKGFVPVGDGSAEFTGIFDGLGHSISGLYINRPTTDYVGLFGSTDADANTKFINNIGLVSSAIIGQAYVGALAGNNGHPINNSYAGGSVTASSHYVGGLVGYNNTAITNSYANVTVTSGDNARDIGGLVGYNYSGNIIGGHAAGDVSGGTGSGQIGGLVGWSNSNANITNSYASGHVSGGSNSYQIGGLVGNTSGVVSSSYASGAVTGGDNSSAVGGLVGQNNGSVSNAYAMGNITVGLNGVSAGGLVGINNYLVANSYAGGVITSGAGSTEVGALVGRNSYNISNISNAFWNSTANPGLSGIGYQSAGTLNNVAGKTATELKTPSTFTTGGATWDFASIWNIEEGTSFPYLRIAEQIPHPAPAGGPAATTCSSCVWDGGGGQDNWSDALNWSANLLPATGASVTIGSDYGTILYDIASLSLASLTLGSPLDILSGKTLTLTGTGTFNAGVSGAGTLSIAGATVNAYANAISVANLKLSSGRLTGAGNLTVSNSFEWTGGTLDSTFQNLSLTNLAKSGDLALEALSDITLTGGVNTNAIDVYAHGNLNINTNGASQFVMIPSGTGSIRLKAGGNLTIGGGAGGTWISTRERNGAASNTASMTLEGANITIQGGNAANAFSSAVVWGTGGLNISTPGTLSLLGNPGYVNSGAQIVTNLDPSTGPGAGHTTITAGSINLAGGGGTSAISTDYSFARIVSGGAQSIATTGDLTLQGGSTSNTIALIVSESTQTLDIGGNLNITGGTGDGASAKIIGHQDQSIAVGNDLSISGGGGQNANALIYAAGTTAANQTITVGRDFTILGATGTTSGAGNGTGLDSDGSIGLSVGRNALIQARNGADSVAAVWADGSISATSGGNLKIQGGSHSNTWAGIGAQVAMEVEVGGGLDLLAGVSPGGGNGAYLWIDNGPGPITINVAGHTLLQGSGATWGEAFIGHYGSTPGTTYLNSTGGTTLTSGVGSYANAVLAGNVEVTGGITFTNGTDMTVSEAQASHLINKSAVTVQSGTVKLDSFSQTGAYSLQVNTGGTLKVADAYTQTGGTATIDGTLQIDGTSSLATPTFLGAGTFKIGNTGNVTLTGTSMPLSLANEGTLTIGGTVTVGGARVDLTAGTVNLGTGGTGGTGGTLALGGSTSTLTWSGGTIAGNGTLNIGTGTFAFGGSGDRVLNAPNITYAFTNLTLPDGSLTLRSGGLTFNTTSTNATTIPAGVTLTLEGGTLTNNGPLNVTGTFNITGGTLTGSGALSNAGTMSLANQTIANAITNTGTINSGGGLTFSQAFTNAGAFKANAGTTTFSNGYLQNAGSLLLNGGDITGNLTLSGGSLSGGVIGGSVPTGGTITGTVAIDGGSLNPGFSPGHLTIAGNLSLGASSVTQVEIGGTGQGTSYDWIDVTGTAALDGTLNISHVNGYAPTTTTTYSGALTAGTISGAFATITTPAQSNYLVGYNLASAPNSVDLTAQVSNTAPPPTPSPVIVAITQSYVGVETPSGLTSLSAYDSPTGFAGSSGGATGTPGTASGANGAPGTATLAAGGRAAADGPPASDQLPLYVLVTPSLMDPGMTPSPEVMDTLRLLFNQFTQDANRQEVQNASRLVCH